MHRAVKEIVKAVQSGLNSSVTVTFVEFINSKGGGIEGEKFATDKGGQAFMLHERASSIKKDSYIERQAMLTSVNECEVLWGWTWNSA